MMIKRHYKQSVNAKVTSKKSFIHKNWKTETETVLVSAREREVLMMYGPSRFMRNSVRNKKQTFDK